MKKTLLLIILILVSAVMASAQFAEYDTLSIYDIQFVTNPDSAQETQYLGDTIVVKGYMCHNPRELWIGARWGGYLTSGTNDPWSGFFIIQDDTVKVNTLLGYVQEGDEIYVTGYLTTYTGLTQLNVLTNPETPITIVSSGNPLPAPRVVTLADLATHAAGEQFESQYVRVENCRVINNAYSNNQAVINDGTATGYIDDYFMYFKGQFNNLLNPWPSNGTLITIQGYTRDIGLAYFSINPRDTNDIIILSDPPPSITNVKRVPGAPTSADPVMVSCDITDNKGVTGATLHYSVDWGAFQTIPVTQVPRVGWAGTIPAQANGAYVRYFVTATDADAGIAQMPGDTTQQVYFYMVRDGDLKIKDLQYTHGYLNDASGYTGVEVTVEGVVMTDSTDWVNNYYIQDDDTMWSGIWVYDNTSQKPNKGDWVRVTGTVQENYNVTRIASVKSLTVVTPGYGAFEPIKVTTGEIKTGGANAEAYESVLICVENVTVTNPFPDGAGNYGEFSINDGTGEVRVDDAFTAFNAQLDTIFKLNDKIEKLIGLHYFSFSNYKILPRDSNDVIGHTTKIEHQPVATVKQFQLDQNYPNPFNRETVIRFTIPEASPVTIEIYNLLGTRVRILHSAPSAPGIYTVRWDGLDNSGRIVGAGVYFCQLKAREVTLTRKMLFLK